MNRRRFLETALMLAATPHAAAEQKGRQRSEGAALTLFLCGDVMTGRGIDQILPHPGDPRLYEPWVSDAGTYVRLAEAANGPIPRPVGPAYIWGDALEILKASAPDVRLVNLETAVTRSGTPWAGKDIHYRMHPDNIACLTAAGLSCAVLANNHVLDWGRAGLDETVESLQRAGIQTAGAGYDRDAAQAPAVLDVPGRGRLLVFSFGLGDSGIPADWGATPQCPGVARLEDLSAQTVQELAGLIGRVKRPRDLVLLSIHWGGNWGYRVPPQHRRFAHALIEEAGVDLVHGHSSHHPRGIEVWKGKLILYGCGDFLNDYEGIEGYEEFRGDLTLMYLPTLDLRSGRLLAMDMHPLQIRCLRLNRATPQDARWMGEVLARESAALDIAIRLDIDGRLHWARLGIGSA
jgi:poly-gamma-glutamate synthesis protein (capsule biosynthesis protein)